MLEQVNRIFVQNVQIILKSKSSMSVKLGPLKLSQKRKLKQLKQKQNLWVLDCINQEKSKLKTYSSVKDKYLKYFVVGVPKKNKFHVKSAQQHEAQSVDSKQFRNFLDSKKQKILQSQTNLQKQNTSQSSTIQLREIQNNGVALQNINIAHKRNSNQIVKLEKTQNSISKTYQQQQNNQKDLSCSSKPQTKQEKESKQLNQNGNIHNTLEEKGTKKQTAVVKQLEPNHITPKNNQRANIEINSKRPMHQADQQEHTQRQNDKDKTKNSEDEKKIYELKTSQTQTKIKCQNTKRSQKQQKVHIQNQNDTKKQQTVKQINNQINNTQKQKQNQQQIQQQKLEVDQEVDQEANLFQ